MTESGTCAGCGKTGDIVRGVCRHSRFSEPRPKLGCLRLAAARQEEYRQALEDFWRNRPRTLTEQLLLWRIRGVDQHGKGCFKPLADLAVGRMRKADPVDPNTPKVSVRTARRAVSGLRIRREILFAGQTERGTNIYVSPGKQYQAAQVPICPHRSIRHLWPIDDAKSLITGDFVEPTDFIIDGYKVNRRLAQEWNLHDIRAAISTIKTWYPDLKRIEHQTALLRSTLRKMKAGQNAVFAARQTEEAKRQDDRRLKQVADDLKRRESRTVDTDQAAELAAGKALLEKILGPSANAVRFLATTQEAAQTPPTQKTTDPPAAQLPPIPAPGAAVPTRPDPQPDKYSIRNQIEAWLKGVEIEARSPETVDYYRSKCKALIRHFPDVAGVSDLELGHLWAYIEFRRAMGTKTATIKKELEALSQVAHSHGIDLRQKSPQLRRLFRKLSSKTERQAKPLSWEEYERLRAELRPERQRALDVAVFTGCRKSELFGLRIEDCDLKRGAVHIRGTKTTRADRWIPLLDELRDIVRHELQTRRSGPIVSKWHCAWRDLGEACDRAGIARRSLVDLRHTFASWLVQAGCSSLSVGQLMGHTNSAMVDRVYGHFDLSALRSTIERMPRGRPPPDPALPT